MRRITVLAISLILLCSLTVTVFADEIAEEAAGVYAGSTTITLTGNGSGGGTGGSGGGGSVTYNLTVPANFSIDADVTEARLNACSVAVTSGIPGNGDTVRVFLRYDGNFTNTTDGSDRIAYSIKKGTGSMMTTLPTNSDTLAYEIPYISAYGYWKPVTSSDETYVCIDSYQWSKTTNGATYRTSITWSSSYVPKTT